MAELQHPETIDRFQIKDVLGKGAQGVVYLARDPSLDRDVAIKAVSINQHLKNTDQIGNLLHEAKTVSKMQHENIISIYDVGDQALNPYLVLEYVEGDTLQSRIRQQPPIKESLHIIRDVLRGVAAAHDKGIIHCDLKPANIMITKQGQAKVADFGLAMLNDAQQENSEYLAGTPQYMAPEYIETRKHQTVSDVFSLGLVFYEMLTGQRAVSGDDVYQLLNQIANKEISPPSTLNPEIDESLDAIIIKALKKDTQERYQTAGEMLKALEQSLALEEAQSQSDNNDATIQFLLRRMSHKKDFPAFSRTISILNRASSSETESLGTVSNAILKDISLTNKVLRIVNSAYYNRGGGKISTISRAVVMLGINPVKNLAVSLLLFEHLQNKAQANQLMEDSVTSLFSALIAHEVAQTNKVKQHEEAFLCALLQQLGKLLVRFYLLEESLAIDKQVEQHNLQEETAALKVLGTSYHKLGMAVAREWGFPETIVNSMKPLAEKDFEKADKPAQKLRAIAQYSNQLSHILKAPAADQQNQIKALGKEYSNLVNTDEKVIDKLINKSKKELTDFAKMINFNLAKSNVYRSLTDEPDEVVQKQFETTQDHLTILEEDPQNLASQQDSEKSLTDGIQDITNSLTSDFTINQIMQMILETIYRSLEGARVMLALRDKASNTMIGKFGYGDSIDQLINQFRIPLAYTADVFHIAFKKNVDIKIDNTQDEKIRAKIPDWYHKKIGSQFFVLFPIIINHSPVALIYIDSTESKNIAISDNQLGLLKTLRNQAILAIKSKSI